MQLATGGVLVAKTYCKARSYLEVKETFHWRFQEKVSPANGTVWKNAKNYEKKGTSLNITKGKSGRRRTVRAEKTMEVVRFYVESNAEIVSCRLNGLALSASTFNKIMKQT